LSNSVNVHYFVVGGLGKTKCAWPCGWLKLILKNVQWEKK